MLQRRFRIGFNRAARLVEELEDRGVVGQAGDAAKPRELLIRSWYQWEEIKKKRGQELLDDYGNDSDDDSPF